MSAAIIAFGAISALGEGEQATGRGEPGSPARVAITRDERLATAGFLRPYTARVRRPNAAMLDEALAQCVASLDQIVPDWRTQRVGLALGTSSGGMLSSEAFFAAEARGERSDAKLARDATYFGPLARVLETLGVDSVSPFTLLLTACAASTLGIGLGVRWIESRQCDIVLAGGFDAISQFVAAGFEVLRATTGEVPPKPFASGRDGMSLGEGAGVVALVPQWTAARAIAYVSGFGASADAVHLTAPDRTGAGLARAASAAIRDAGISGGAIDLVSGHATATPFNDAAESEALRRVLQIEPGSAVKRERPVLHSFKAQIGHTLGAAGVLESIHCLDAMTRQVLPATPITTALDADLPGRVLAVAESGVVDHVLKLSAAFGGANAALVLTRERPAERARTRRPVFVSRAVHVATAPSATELGTRLGVPAEKFARTDILVRLALGACARLVDREGPLAGAGVVVGHALATIETNAAFDVRLRERGPRAAEPRKFPYTSPNAVAGECGATFGWNGPGVAVGGGFHGALEALCIAADLVQSGDSDRMVVVGVDEIGPAARAWMRAAFGRDDLLGDGAVALVVSSEPSWARILGAETTLEGEALSHRGGPRLAGSQHEPPRAWGHRALLPLSGEEVPARLVCACPFGGLADVALAPARSRSGARGS